MEGTKYGIFDPRFNTWIGNKQFEIYIFDTVKLAEAQIRMLRYKGVIDRTSLEAVNRYIVKPYEEE